MATKKAKPRFRNEAASALFRRKTKQLKLREIAATLDVTIPYVSMLKQAKCTPGLEIATRIEEHYGVPAGMWRAA